jgi:hypothetical protein
LAPFWRQKVDSRVSTINAIEKTLSKAGVEFLPAGEKGEGVRMKSPRRSLGPVPVAVVLHLPRKTDASIAFQVWVRAAGHRAGRERPLGGRTARDPEPVDPAIRTRAIAFSNAVCDRDRGYACFSRPKPVSRQSRPTPRGLGLLTESAHRDNASEVEGNE